MFVFWITALPVSSMLTSKLRISSELILTSNGNGHVFLFRVYALPGNLQLDNIPPMAMLCEIETFIDLPESWSEEEASKILRSSCFQRARAVFSPGHGNIIEGLFIEGRNIVHDLLAVAHPLLEKAEEEKVNQDQADV